MKTEFNENGKFLETKNEIGETISGIFKKAAFKLNIYRDIIGNWICEITVFGCISIKFDITVFINSLKK
jgi:hypothetical protein